VLLQPRQGLLAQGLRAAAGQLRRARRPIVNLLPLEQGERINATLPVPEYEEGSFVFMATSKGTVKKTPLRTSRARCRAASSPSTCTRTST
jgi:DNA gyrase/topoisomerase IV subunit A